MYKRGIAFLLAAVLAFSPVMQVNAAQVSAPEEIMVLGETLSENQDESVTPGELPDESEMPEETGSQEETDAPEETMAPVETPSENPDESETPEAMPEESATPDESPSAEPDESEEPTESVAPEASAEPSVSPEAPEEPSEIPEVSAEPSEEPSESPEAEESLEETMDEAEEELEEESAVDTELVTLITEDITISADTADTSGEGWTWVKNTKTFTMNGFQLQGQLTLPDGAVIVLAKGSENSIDTSAKYNRFCIRATGDLTIKGKAKLTLKYMRQEALRVEGNVILRETNVNILNESTQLVRPFSDGGGTVMVSASNVRMEIPRNSFIEKSFLFYEGCTITCGDPNPVYYYFKLNEETGRYEIIFKPSKIFVTKQPERINKLYVGESVCLTMDAESVVGEKLTYQWYSTTKCADPDSGAVKVKNATEKSLVVQAQSHGITYYFCKVTSESTDFNTDVAAVVASEHKGLKICTEKPSFTSTQDKLATEGWKYDSTTHTLTFENMDMLLPFQDNFTMIQIKSGYNVVINGTNYIEDNDGRIGITKDGKVGNETTFSGTGCLYTNDIDLVHASSDMEIWYIGDITMHLTAFSPDTGKSVLDGATIKTVKSNVVKGQLILQRGACFEALNAINMKADLVVDEGSTLVTGESLSCIGNLTIGNDAQVIIEKSLLMNNIWETGANLSRVLQIAGTLSIRSNNSSYPLQLYSKAETPIILDGVKVITPANAVLSKSGYNYQYVVGDDTNIGELLIGKAGLETKEISGSKEIAGTARYGKILTAGAVTPADASVAYQWQYAKNPSDTWLKIDGQKENTYTVETKYHGYYLRVVTYGIGAYSGEVISKAVGPVVGDPLTLTGIWFEGGSGGIQSAEDMQYTSRPFNGHRTSYSFTSDATEEGTVNYAVTTAYADAIVTFRKKNSDFTEVGRSARIPVETGENEITIEIEVAYGGETCVYTITHEIIQMKYSLSLCVDSWYEEDALTATWTNQDGQVQSYTVDADSYYQEVNDIIAGTEITLTSTVGSGRYPFKYLYDYDEGYETDVTKPGYPATFCLNDDTEIYLESSGMAAYPPEELSARWQLTDDSMQVTVKALQQNSVYSDFYEETTIEVLDSTGNVVDSHTTDGVTEPDTDGYYRMSFTGLDCTKEYEIRAYYTYVRNERVPLEEQTATYTLKKRTPVLLKTASDHIVLMPGEKSFDIPIIFEGYAGAEVRLESGYDTAVVSADIIKDGSGNRNLSITAKGEGTTYITLRGDDYETKEGMQYVFTSVRVDVSSVDVAPPLNLGVKSGTLNLYQDTSLTIPVYKMECGHEIESAQFASAALNEKFAITVVNDRTVKVTPIVPADDGAIDYSKWLKERGRTGTFSSKIVVNYKDGTASRISTEKLKITLTAKKPEVTVSALSFNSFYTKQSKNLKVSVKGKKLAGVQVDTAKTSGTKVACPEWITYDEASRKVFYDDAKTPSTKTSGFLYLKVWPEGYRIPVQTKAKINVAYKAPKLKVNKSSVTVLNDIKATPAVSIKLTSADKNVKYSTIGVQSVELISYMDYMKLNSKNRNSHVSPQVFDKEISFDKKSGQMELKLGQKPTAGKVVLYADIANGKKPVKVSFNLKLGSAPTLKLNKDSVTMDAVFGSYTETDKQIIKLTCSMPGYRITEDKIHYKTTMVGDKKKTDYTAHFSYAWNENTKEISIYRMTTAVVGKTYKVTVSVDGIKKPVSFNVKVIKSKTPAFKISKEEIILNRMAVNGTEKVRISLPKKFGTNWFITKSELVAPEGTSGSMGVNMDYNPVSCGVSFYATENTVPGTYIYQVYGGLPSTYNGAPGHEDDSVKHAEIKIKVVDQFPSVTVDKTAVTLNKDLAALDTAVVNLTVDDSYKYAADEPWNVLTVKDVAGNDAEEPEKQLMCWTSGTKLNIKCTDATVYGATYKVRLACAYAYDKVDADTVITVKVAPKGTKISMTGKSQGSIDTTRPATSAKIKYTYTNWNVAEYAASEIPVLEWEVYAKNGKKNVKMTDGALSDTGLVAKGSSATDTPTEAGSWFKDITAGYDMALGINMDSAAWRAGDILPTYTYTVKATLKFPNTEEEIKANAVTFKVKQGTVKYAVSPKSATLNKLDPKGRSIFTIKDKNTYWYDVVKIAKVEVVADKNVPVSKKIEVVPVYGMNQKTSYAVYWKDKKVANVKSGTVKVNIYLEGNDPARKKPNASFNLKVTVK